MLRVHVIRSDAYSISPSFRTRKIYRKIINFVVYEIVFTKKIIIIISPLLVKILLIVLLYFVGVL